MNFEELKQELYARGTDYLEEDADGVARAERWLNQGYRKILNLHAWPFLQSSATSAPPVSIPTLRKILNVYRTDDYQPLARTTVEDLQGQGIDLSQTGTPEYYYVGSGNTVHTWPVGTDSVTVRYSTRVAPLTGTDTPLFDEEYHNLIVDAAMIYAYRDGDNFEAAAALQAELDSALSAMGEDYMLDSREPLFILVVDPYDG